MQVSYAPAADASHATLRAAADRLSSSRYLDDTSASKRRALDRARKRYEDEVRECTFSPRITAYADVAKQKAALAGPDTKEGLMALPLEERAARRAAATEAKKAQMKADLEAALLANATFRPQILHSGHPGAPSGGVATTDTSIAASASPSVAGDRLYQDAIRLRHKRLEAQAAKLTDEEEAARDQYRPTTNATSAAIVAALADPNAFAGDGDGAGAIRPTGEEQFDLKRFQDRMRNAELVARERRRALLQERNHEWTFKPNLAPFSEATVLHKREEEARHRNAASSSHTRAGPRDATDELYRVGVAQRQAARDRAVEDQRTREREECVFHPIVNPASAEIAARASDAILGSSKGPVEGGVPPVVERQWRLLEAHKRHMEELKRATHEADAAAIRARRAEVLRSHHTSFSNAVGGSALDVSGTTQQTYTSAATAAQQERHVAEMQLRQQLSARSKAELAAEVQATECPFRPAINPTSAQLARTRRSRSASAHQRQAGPQSTRSASAASSIPEARNELPPRPNSRGSSPTIPTPAGQWDRSADGGGSFGEAAGSNDDAASVAGRNVITKAAFKDFMAKQRRHVNKVEADRDAMKREIDAQRFTECTFHPRTHPAPSEEVRAVDGSVARRARGPQTADTSRASAPLATGESSFYSRQHRARVLRQDKQRREALVAVGRNPNASGAAAADAVVEAGLVGPHVEPFSFQREAVDPVTGSVVRGRSAIDARKHGVFVHADRPRSADAVARRRGDLHNTSAASAGTQQPHNYAVAGEYAFRKRPSSADSRRVAAREVAVPTESIVLRQPASAVQQAIRRFVGKDAHVRQGFGR
jgi:hypothetical protein